VGVVGLSFLFALYSLYAKFRMRSPQGFTALILAMTFFSGVNLFFLGIIGEYVGRIYEEAKRRPHYVVLKIVRHSGVSTSGKSGVQQAEQRDVPLAESH
jgi:dolichol-phosphate mannosyltransferase